MSTTDEVRRHFEKEAIRYDHVIARIVPKYDEQHQVMLKMVPYGKHDKLKALDLGAGTGVLSLLLLEEFPKLTVTVFDVSDNMLRICRDNLIPYEDRVLFLKGKLEDGDFGEGYHLIVSGLAIHHLSHKQKKELCSHIFRSLLPGGVFLNGDIVLGETPRLGEHYLELWRRSMREKGEDEHKWYAEYLNQDLPATLGEQLSWLQEAGFVDVACHWRYLNFAVWGGRKPGAND